VSAVKASAEFAVTPLNAANRPCAPAAGTAPAFRAVSTAVGGAAATSITIPVPAGTVQGDLLIAGHVQDMSSALMAPTDPLAGWNLVEKPVSGSVTRATVYWRFAPASPPASYAFTFSTNTNGSAGFMAAYTGADPTSPVGASDKVVNASATTVTAPTLTPTTTPTTLLTVMGIDNVAAITPTTPAGTTLRALVTSSFDGGDQDKILYADQALSGTGTPTGGRTSSLGANSRVSVGISLLLKAAPGAVDPQIDLSWTITPDTYATGYEIIRSGGPTTSVTPRATLAWSDTTTAAGTAYTYTISAVDLSWRSTTRTVNVAIC
jgi:hypothetical protein